MKAEEAREEERGSLPPCGQVCGSHPLFPFSILSFLIFFGFLNVAERRVLVLVLAMGIMEMMGVLDLKWWMGLALAMG